MSAWSLVTEQPVVLSTVINFRLRWSTKFVAESSSSSNSISCPTPSHLYTEKTCSLCQSLFTVASFIGSHSAETAVVAASAAVTNERKIRIYLFESSLITRSPHRSTHDSKRRHTVNKWDTYNSISFCQLTIRQFHWRSSLFVQYNHEKSSAIVAS